MKKRFIALFVAMVMVLGMFTACSSSRTISSQQTQTSVDLQGRYHCFTTENDQEYLNFLEAFDETKYEIVDISHSKFNWYVTYKDIEE